MDIDKRDGSVGIVETQTAVIDLPSGGLRLSCGQHLPELSVAYETYGELSPSCDNVVYICHALTGDAHVAGRHSDDDNKPGWWDEMVGPGKGIDTNYYFVVCSNILGGCAGTTGPSSINPATGTPYGSDFPQITIADIVNVQKLLLDHLKINRIAAVIGGSLGGMLSLEWSIRYPDMVDRCICIATGSSLSAQALAFDTVACNAITADPNWKNGDYYDSKEKPEWGLSHARKIGHITYLSPEIMQKKFGRQTKDDENAQEQCFQIESYLDYQGEKFVERFDANSYLRITQAMDAYDLVKEFGSLDKAFKNVVSKFLIVGLSSDWLFPPEQSNQLANALLRSGKRVSCCILRAPYGHDAFLIDVQRLADTVRAFLPWAGETKEDKTVEILPNEKDRFSIITNSVQSGARVLDLGCGDGQLLSLLKEEKKTNGLGLDINIDNIVEVINKGHDIFQGNLDEGLSLIPDDLYDYAILSSTLQVVKKPKVVLREMLRVAKEGIVTLPNFGNWHNRIALAFSGRMPKSGMLPYEWYDTPNIHLSTLKDFVDLCRQEEYDILDIVCIPGERILDRLFLSLKFCNLGAERVLFRLAKKGTGAVSLPNCRVF